MTGHDLQEASRQALDRAVRRLEAAEAADRAERLQALFTEALVALWTIGVLLALALLRELGYL